MARHHCRSARCDKLGRFFVTRRHERPPGQVGEFAVTSVLCARRPFRLSNLAMKPQRLVLVMSGAVASLCAGAAFVIVAGPQRLPLGLGGWPMPTPLSLGLLAMSALALFLASSRSGRIAGTLGLVVAAGALAALAATGQGRRVLRLDLFLEGAQVPLPPPHAALALVALGLALAGVSTQRRVWTRLGHAFALLALAASCFVLVARLFGAQELYAAPPQGGMSPVAAVSIVLLCVGILAVSPRFSLVRVFYTATHGGRLARRFLPFVFLIPLAVALVVESGLRRGWYSAESGLAILVMCVIAALGALTWRYALNVNAGEARLQRLVRSRTHKLSESVSEVEEFSQALAHDVRGPLINLREFLHIVRDEHAEALAAEARDYLDRAISATRRVDLLTQAMLRYGELSRSNFVLRPVDAEQVLRGVIAEREGQSLCGPAEFTVRSPLGEVVADADGLANVFRALLDNACRFTRPGARPQVTIWSEQNRASSRIVVRDEGIGVRAEFQARIFRPFEQLKREPAHAGIGLALVRRAVTKMNGQTGVISDGVAGSAFWIELPRPGAPGASATSP